MPTNKFLTLVNNVRTLVTAIASSAGAGDANKIIATGADGRIDTSLMPVGIGADVAVVAASETLAAGDYVNIWNDAGTPKVRKASSTDDTKPAHGFVKDGFAAAASATVYFEGQNTSLTGLTAGTIYVLSKTVAGGVTAIGSYSQASGNIIQVLGVAVTATAMSTEVGDYVKIA